MGQQPVSVIAVSFKLKLLKLIAKRIWNVLYALIGSVECFHRQKNKNNGDVSIYITGVPVYKESAYTARTIQDRGDSNYTKITGPTNFAPYYPTYAAVQPPPLPQ